MNEFSELEHSRLDDWIDVFSAGTHTDSAGTTRTWTERQLDQIAGSVTSGTVPVVVGHPQNDAPAYAWVDRLRRVGQQLQARFRDIDPGFRQLVEAGRFRNRSISLKPVGDGKWALRHVGFLGAAAPAVSGLKPVAFDDDAEHVSYEFQDALDMDGDRSDWVEFRAIRRMMRALREWIIDRESVERADRVVPEIDLRQIAGGPEFSDTGNSGTTDNTSENNREADDVNTNTGSNGGDLAAREVAITAREAAAERRETALDERDAASQAEQRYAEADALIGEHVAAGRILPAEHQRMARFMASLEDEDAVEIEFSDADGTTRKQSRTEIFKKFLAALPVRVSYAEISAREPGADDQSQEARNKEIADKAGALHSELRSKGVAITMPAAVDRVRREMGVTP